MDLGNTLQSFAVLQRNKSDVSEHPFSGICSGSGDVLTGILLGLLAQGYSREEACKLGVYIHGLAGDIAAEEKTQMGMTAADIIEALPAAWKKLTL